MNLLFTLISPDRQRWRSVLRVLASVLALASFAPAARTLYSYQDDHGNRVFTDRPPASGIPVETRPLAVQELPTRISIRNRGSSEQPVLSVINDYYGPIEVEISAPTLENMRAEPALPVRLVAPARAETVAVRLYPLGPHWRYNYQARAVLGDPAAVHRPEQPYAPPFAPGARFVIGQAFNGTFSHLHDHHPPAPAEHHRFQHGCTGRAVRCRADHVAADLRCKLGRRRHFRAVCGALRVYRWPIYRHGPSG